MHSLQSVRIHRWQKATGERGAVLLVSLVMLLLLTIIGLSAVNLTTLDTRIAANSKDKKLAFDAAEAALNEAGGVLAPANPLPDSSTAGFLSSTMSQAWWATATDSWWNTNGVSLGSYSGIGNGVEYIIEQPEEILGTAGSRVKDITLGAPKPVTRFYRVTSRGSGPGGAEVMVQSVYARKVYLNVPD